MYDPATDCYRCPTGHLLRRMGRTRTGTPLGGIQYRADPQVCRACPLKVDCCDTAAARTITRPDDAGLSERVRAYLATRQAKRSLRRRGCWVETANAELKDRHGLRRAQCRGRAKVQMQAYGAAIAYNVKKLVTMVRPQPVGAAGALTVSADPAACSRELSFDRLPSQVVGARCETDVCPRRCIAPAGSAVCGHLGSTSRHFGNRPCRNQ